MRTPRIRALVFIVIAVLAGALLTAPAADAARRVSGPQRFLAISTSIDENASIPLAATGAIHAYGKDVTISDTTDRFEFPKGNVNIRHNPKGKGHDHTDAKACYSTYTEKGTWRATSGTGRYDDVRGKGTYRLLVQIFGCDPEAVPDQIVITITATGRLSY
jgi:hypothetical protein